MYSSTLSLTSMLDGGGWSTPRPGRFTPGRRPGTYFIGGWVSPRAGLDGCGKSHPLLGFDPQTFQPVACRYTDYAILTPKGTPRGCGNSHNAIAQCIY